METQVERISRERDELLGALLMLVNGATRPNGTEDSCGYELVSLRAVQVEAARSVLHRVGA